MFLNSHRTVLNSKKKCDIERSKALLTKRNEFLSIPKHGGSIDEGREPRLLMQKKLGPDSSSTNSMTSGRHLTCMNRGSLVSQTKGSYCSRLNRWLWCN